MLPAAAPFERVTGDPEQGPDQGPGQAPARRPPRWAYWLVGAVVACTGAFAANRLAADLPLADRLPYWLAGTAVIFLGLWILAKGSRAHRAGDDGAG